MKCKNYKPDCTDFINGVCNGICEGEDMKETDTKTEPDEMIFELFRSVYPECTKYCVFENGHFSGRKTGAHPSAVGFWNGKYQEFKSGYLAGKAKMEADISKKYDELLNETGRTIWNLQAEIESMKCCGNCSMWKPNDYGCKKDKSLFKEPIQKCDNWVSKSKLWGGLPLIQEPPCNH